MLIRLRLPSQRSAPQGLPLGILVHGIRQNEDAFDTCVSQFPSCAPEVNGSPVLKSVEGESPGKSPLQLLLPYPNG